MAEPLRVCSFLFCLGFLWLEAFNLCDGDLWSAVTDSWWPFMVAISVCHGCWECCQSDGMLRKRLYLVYSGQEARKAAHYPGEETQGQGDQNTERF